MDHTARICADPPAAPVGPPWAFTVLCCSLQTPLWTQGTLSMACGSEAHSSRRVYRVSAKKPVLGVCGGGTAPPSRGFPHGARPLQQHPSVQLRGDCPPVGPRSQGVEGVTGVSPRALPLLWASSAATRDRATRPRRPEVVGGLWDHAGVSLRHPTPSELPGGAEDPEANSGIRVGGSTAALRGPPGEACRSSLHPGACPSASPASREAGWGHGTRPAFSAPLLGLCLSPAPQYSSTAPCPPLAEDLEAGENPACVHLLRAKAA